MLEESLEPFGSVLQFDSNESRLLTHKKKVIISQISKVFEINGIVKSHS